MTIAEKTPKTPIFDNILYIEYPPSLFSGSVTSEIRALADGYTSEPEKDDNIQYFRWLPCGFERKEIYPDAW